MRGIYNGVKRQSTSLQEHLRYLTSDNSFDSKLLNSIDASFGKEPFHVSLRNVNPTFLV